MHRFVRAFTRLGSVSALVGVVLASAGCGGSTATRTVSGKVTIGGEPMKRGTITFVSTVGNKDAFVGQINNGEYTAGPMPVGLCKVMITISPPPPGAGGGNDMGPRPKDKDKEPLAPNTKYSDVNTSGLEYTVVDGDNKYNPADLQPAAGG